MMLPQIPMPVEARRNVSLCSFRAHPERFHPLQLQTHWGGDCSNAPSYHRQRLARGLACFEWPAAYPRQIQPRRQKTFSLFLFVGRSFFLPFATLGFLWFMLS